jgi:branched-chain amino acid transport system substrate-binding protein
VVLGTAGSLSGPAGIVYVPIVKGLQVWVKDVNSRGGANGHEVKLNIYDDGGDPSRHRSQVQQAVEQDGVKAFLANPEAITGACCIAYINTKRIPVIGSETGSPWFNTNPMYFPHASSGDDANYGAIAAVAQQMTPKGKRKVAAFTCVEAQACKDAQRVWFESAEKLGLEVVYQRQVSVGQPDFTAECLAAQNAGADIVLMGFDTNTVRRMVSSCSRQSYRPTYGTLTVAVTSAYGDDPNFDGMVASSPVFPWFATGTPATNQYQAAMTRFGSNLAPSASLAIGWVAGKVFERAAGHLAEPPTSEAILEGLWSIQNDDIGGLTLPLTYQREKPSPQKACWFNLLLEGRTWRSPDRFRLNCG